jgi:tetratricopeptide (TPR) repeat protein
VKLQSENPQYLNAAGLMAYTFGRYGDAELLLEQSLAITKKALGPEHPEVAQSLNSLAGLYRVHGPYTKAEPLYQQALVILKKALGPEHPDVATALENYAELLSRLKRDKEAANLRAQAKAARARLGNRS